MGICGSKKQKKIKENLKGIEKEKDDQGYKKYKEYEMVYKRAETKTENLKYIRENLIEIKDVHHRQGRRKSVSEYNMRLSKVARSLKKFEKVNEDYKQNRKRYSSLLLRDHSSSKFSGFVFSRV